MTTELLKNYIDGAFVDSASDKATPGQRQSALLALADAIEAHSDELVEAQCRNTGRPKAIIAVEEIKVGADQLSFFAGPVVTSHSSPRCRTAASNTPATATTCPRTASRTTPGSSTS
ncbi:aldehyde dehydrogenase family protein [Rhodococcus sp. OK519]|nr:aldehyde dehydrogenase family protein [Rhodococcus sp. OK519]